MQRNKEKLWNYLSNNPCVDCGESDPVVLDLDHVRGEKEINIGEEVHNLAWPRIMKEIEKCEVRCANCHFRVTAIRSNSIKYQILQEEAWTHTK